MKGLCSRCGGRARWWAPFSGFRCEVHKTDATRRDVLEILEELGIEPPEALRRLAARQRRREAKKRG